MNIPKDRIGNELHLHELVTISLAQDMYVGTITEIKQGGISLASLDENKNPRQTPNLLFVTVQIPIPFNPGYPLTGVLKLVDPRSQEMIATAIKNIKEQAKDNNSPFFRVGDSDKLDAKNE